MVLNLLVSDIVASRLHLSASHPCPLLTWSGLFLAAPEESLQAQPGLEPKLSAHSGNGPSLT